VAGILRGPTGRRAVLAGIVVVVAWASLAAWSGRMTPLARRPVLDGLGPPLPYRWVDPPPELAAPNLPPTPGAFTLPLGPEGVRADLLFTSDNQVNVIVDNGAIAPASGERSVKLTVDPLDPSGLPPPAGELVAFGNAVRIAAVYLPSGTPVPSTKKDLDVVLVYPATSTLQSRSHQILYSADGTRWRKLETTDSLVQHSAEARIPGFGTVLVAAVPEKAPITPQGGGSGRSPFLIVAVVVAACAILVGVGLILRTRTPRGPS
jgi:hypothetical protein